MPTPSADVSVPSRAFLKTPPSSLTLTPKPTLMRVPNLSYLWTSDGPGGLLAALEAEGTLCATQPAVTRRRLLLERQRVGPLDARAC